VSHEGSDHGPAAHSLQRDPQPGPSGRQPRSP
jgi:hypothetical protein